MTRSLLTACIVAAAALGAPGLARAEAPALDEALPPSVQELIDQLQVVAEQLDEGQPEADRGATRVARPVVVLMGPGVELPARSHRDNALRFTLRPGSRGAWVRAGIHW